MEIADRMTRPELQGEEILLLSGREVAYLLRDREEAVLGVVKAAYLEHFAGNVVMPHASFLRPPHVPGSRIISAPAYLGGEEPAAGVKWVSSFPANLAQGLARASAVIVMNDVSTGRPTVVLEGSLISAARTAASAALAAAVLCPASPESVAIIGAGPINFEVCRFLRVVFPALETVRVHDLDAERARRFGVQAVRRLGYQKALVEDDVGKLLREEVLVSFATSATEPYLNDRSWIRPGTTVLHLSLRDLAPEVLTLATNVVDDHDHALQARTSLQLAQALSPGENLVAATLGELLIDKAILEHGSTKPRIFSPFGLAILDLAVAQLVTADAVRRSLGTRWSFFPQPFDL